MRRSRLNFKEILLSREGVVTVLLAFSFLVGINQITFRFVDDTLGTILTIIFWLFLIITVTLFVRYETKRFSWRKDHLKNVISAHDIKYSRPIGRDYSRTFKDLLVWRKTDEIDIFVESMRYSELAFKKEADSKTWSLVSVITIPLPRKLPHIFLVSKALKLKIFDKKFNLKQKQSLEGDFNEHYDIYAPDGYHIDARSVISPDAMSAMLDIGPYDIEIDGKSLYLYTGQPTVENVISMIDDAKHLRKKMLDHIVYYKDERTETGEVAKKGQLLRPRLKLRSITIMAMLAALIVFDYLVIVPNSRGSNGPSASLILLVFTPLIYSAYMENKKYFDDFIANMSKKKR